eukprot:6411035-Pyramimonas_sp.AAC.1
MQLKFQNENLKRNSQQKAEFFEKNYCNGELHYYYYLPPDTISAGRVVRWVVHLPPLEGVGIVQQVPHGGVAALPLPWDCGVCGQLLEVAGIPGGL